MGTPQYVKDAHNNYNAKFDLVQIRLPKGAKERIKAVLEDGQSIAGYCVQSVLVALESDEEYLQTATEEPQNVQEAAGYESADKLPARHPERPETTKTDTRTEAEQWAELQALIDAKKAEQDEQKRRKEEEKAREKQERTEELKNYVRQMKADADKRKQDQIERFSQVPDEEIKALLCGDDRGFRDAIADPANKDAYIDEIGEENYNRFREILEEIENEEKVQKRAETIAAAKDAE